MNTKGRSIDINIGKECLSEIFFCMYMKFFSAFLIFFVGGWLACTGLLVTDAPASDTTEMSFFQILFDEWQKNATIGLSVLPLGILFFPIVDRFNKRKDNVSKTIGLISICIIFSILFYSLIPGSFYYLYPPQKTVGDTVKSLELLFETILPYPGNLLAVLPTAVLTCVASAVCVAQVYNRKVVALISALIVLVPGLHYAKSGVLERIKGPPEATDIDQEGAEECCESAYQELLMHGYLATNGTIAVIIAAEEICQSRCSTISNCMDVCEQQKDICRNNSEDGNCRKNYDLCLRNCPQPPSSVLIK